MTTTHDPAAIRRDQIRTAVRVTAEHLAVGDTVQPWNDRTSPARTVSLVVHPGEHTLIRWTDGTQDVVHKWAVFHRNVKL